MFDKIFNKKVVVPFFSGVGTVAIFQWIVFPGLTAADTIINILAGIIGFFTLVYVYYMIGIDKLFKPSEAEVKLQQEWNEHIEKVQSEVKVPKKKSTTKSKTTKPKKDGNI